jgi:hypothetical protein
LTNSAYSNKKQQWEAVEPITDEAFSFTFTKPSTLLCLPGRNIHIHEKAARAGQGRHSCRFSWGVLKSNSRIRIQGGQGGTAPPSPRMQKLSLKRAIFLNLDSRRGRAGRAKTKLHDRLASPAVWLPRKQQHELQSVTTSHSKTTVRNKYLKFYIAPNIFLLWLSQLGPYLCGQV